MIFPDDVHTVYRQIGACDTLQSGAQHLTIAIHDAFHKRERASAELYYRLLPRPSSELRKSSQRLPIKGEPGWVTLLERDGTS